MKVCQYNWHSASLLGWPFPVLKYEYIFQIKYTEATVSNNTLRLLWFEISKVLIAVLKNCCVICSVVTNTQFIVFIYFGKYLHSDDYLNTIAVLKYCTNI